MSLHVEECKRVSYVEQICADNSLLSNAMNSCLIRDLLHKRKQKVTFKQRFYTFSVVGKQVLCRHYCIMETTAYDVFFLVGGRRGTVHR